ncbi:MAG TPA: hypothetical protein VJ951_05810 [Bacteroidales bacterium]|nr:hypothetical protein [Bacteroidales bacterium]
MKYLIIFLFTAIAYAQSDRNALGETAFEAIEINGQTLGQIKATHGQKSQMQNLFGSALDYKAYNSGRSIKYTYTDLSLAFSAWITASATPELSSFEITGPSTTITIGNIEFSVGDNISVLSPLNLVENTSGNYLPGTKAYIIAPCAKCNHYIYIRFNMSSQLITEIGYIELT